MSNKPFQKKTLPYQYNERFAYLKKSDEFFSKDSILDSEIDFPEQNCRKKYSCSYEGLLLTSEPLPSEPLISALKIEK